MPSKRKKFNKERERKIIARMFLQGCRQTDIAKKIERTDAYVAIELKRLSLQWREQANIDFSLAKSVELAKIENLERTYWMAWLRSVGEAKSVTVKGIGQKAGEKDKTLPVSVERSERTENKDGDPRYLQGVQWCIERRVKLFGFDQPIKFELVDEIKRKMQEYGITPEDLAKFPGLSEFATRYGLGESGIGGNQTVGKA